MADLKISQLTGATTPLAGTEVLPIVQSSSTKKVSVADLTAGRTVAMTQLDVGNLRAAVNTLSSTNTDGNIIIDPNGNGMTGVNMTPNSSGGQLQVAGENATTSIAGVPTVSLIDGDANNEYCNLRYATSANGSLGVVGFKAVTTGSYPSSVGALEIAIQNGAGSNTVLTGTAAGELSVPIGNLAFSTAGKGINFTANTPAAGMTSELLNWYEEGAFTPVIADAATGGNAGTAEFTFARYTRIGRKIFFNINLVNANTAGMTAGNTLFLRGLPFTAGNWCNGFSNMAAVTNFTYAGTMINAEVYAGGTYIRFYDVKSATGGTLLTVAAILSGSSNIYINGSYEV